MKESIAAPALSLSTPDLHDMSHHNTFQPLRRSASSSEILYEKVMQRFYQAVELDEAEMAKKRGNSLDRPNAYSKLKNYSSSVEDFDMDTSLVNIILIAPKRFPQNRTF